MKELDSIPNQLRSLYCLIKPEYKSSSANRKFNCKCDNCRKWNTLRNFYRMNTKIEYRERQKMSSKKWVKLNPESKRRSEAKRRSVYNERYSEKEVLSRYGSDCNICGLPINLDANRSPGKIGWEYSLHIDHLIPVSKGGTDTLENVRPTHGICNVKKGARL